MFGMPSKENFSMVISVEIGQQQMFGFVTICQKFPFQIVFIALGKRFAEKFAQQLTLFAYGNVALVCIQLTPPTEARSDAFSRLL